MIDTGAEANICKYNCLSEDKWEKLKTPMVVYFLSAEYQPYVQSNSLLFLSCCVGCKKPIIKVVK